MPILLIVGCFSIILMFLLSVKNEINLLGNSSDKMLLGFFAAIIVSNLSHGYLGGIKYSIASFFPIIVGYTLVIHSVIDKKKLWSFVVLLICLSSILAYEGLLQHTSGSAHGGLPPIVERATSLEGESVGVERIRWYGVFNDPNDFGMVLILVVPLIFELMFRGNYLFSIVSMSLILPAIFYTNSRGTILAGLVSVCAYFVLRYKSYKGLAIGGFIAFLLFAFGPSRISSISGKEASAYGRISAWYEAYQMFKENPFFGVGHNMFTDHHWLTAHNSYVLVMAELGAVGLFFFTGLIYHPLYWLWQNVFVQQAHSISKTDLGLISAIYASFAGILFSMFFLSRSYMLLPFLMFALASASTRIFSEKKETMMFDGSNAKHFRNIAILTFVQILFINIIVKIFI
ncbi:MAG: O-antigen ligase family protein [Paludibacter sp.]|nr:O-antigen ligase family protein [Paludibacter sp.]